MVIKYALECARTVMDRDPAATSLILTLLYSPGVKALVAHYRAHKHWIAGRKAMATRIAYKSRKKTGIEIHPGATIGRRVILDHGTGIVIGETAIVGDDCTIFHGVTLGGTTSARDVKRHPTVEDGVLIGAASIILGDITLGKKSKVGANSVVLKDIPPYSTAVGAPARVIQHEDKKWADEILEDIKGKKILESENGDYVI